MGCGSSKQAEDTSQPPIPLQHISESPRPAPGQGGKPSRPPSRSAHRARPSSSLGPPSSSHRLSGSRPTSSRRIPGSSHGGGGRRPVSASGSSTLGPRHRGSRPSSSSGRVRHSTVNPDRFNVIPEYVRYAEDSTIIRTTSTLKTYIDQHVLNFYVDDGVDPGSHRPLIPEMEHQATSLYGIRKYIAQKIISDIVMAKGESSPEITTATSAPLSNELLPYAIAATNAEREDHLHELYLIGVELRTLISLHPSRWEFGPWEMIPGYLMVFPPLMRDGECVARGQSFTI